MEENRKVSENQGPSLQVVLVKGGFAPSRGVVPRGEQCQVLQGGSGKGALVATLWLLSLWYLALRGSHRPGAVHSFLPAPRETREEKCAEYVETGRASSAGLGLLTAPRNVPSAPLQPQALGPSQL